MNSKIRQIIDGEDLFESLKKQKDVRYVNLDSEIIETVDQESVFDFLLDVITNTVLENIVFFEVLDD